MSQVLVGDVGGTHARFAVVEIVSAGGKSEGKVGPQATLDDDFPTFADAVRAGLDRIGTRPEAASIAVAGPVTEGRATFTNRGWKASEEELKKLGFKYALLINDFAALAFAAGHIPEHELHTIGPEREGLPDEPVSIVGAGTGFGVSCLARYRGRSVPIASEGGHIGFAPESAREIELLRALSSRFGRVSVERLLSGPGIENIHRALCEIEAKTSDRPDAAAIQQRADRGDALAGETLSLFCAIFGAVAGDIALVHGARGGVFIAGGVAQKLESRLKTSSFRARFENKGRLSDYVKPIPTRLILSENAAFLGAARASIEFRDER